MANISARSSIVKNAQEVCNEGIQDLNRTASHLQRCYQDAGQSWKDSKYAQLGGIVHECSTALRHPINELVDCLNKLKNLETALLEYESTNL